MEAIYHGIIALTTAAGIAIASMIGGAAVQDEPKQETQVVVTVCGSGGLVPPNSENKCEND